MELDGPTFVPKSGYLFTNLGQGLRKLAFSSFFSQFYEMAFLKKCCFFFQTRNSPSSLFLAFLAVVLSQLCPNIVERSLFY